MVKTKLWLKITTSEKVGDLQVDAPAVMPCEVDEDNWNDLQATLTNREFVHVFLSSDEKRSWTRLRCSEIYGFEELEQ